VRQARADRGRHRRLTAELAQLIEGLALRTPPPTAAYIHRQVAALASQHGWPIPSYRSVSEIIRQLDPGLLTLAHQGTKAYRERFDLLHRREATRPNEIWQADHSLLAIWLRDDEGRPARPWLTVIMDDYSRAIAGFGLSLGLPSRWPIKTPEGSGRSWRTTKRIASGPSDKRAEHRQSSKTLLDHAKGRPELMTRSVRPASPDADVVKGRDERYVDQEEKRLCHQGPKASSCLHHEAG
jgi:hypothetical protein